VGIGEIGYYVPETVANAWFQAFPVFASWFCYYFATTDNFRAFFAR